MDDDVHGNGISVVKTSKVGDQVFFRFTLFCCVCFSCSLSSHYPSLTAFLLLSSLITLHLSQSLLSYPYPLSSPRPSSISDLIPILSFHAPPSIQSHPHNRSREDRISSVFRPSLSAPTMTLEEFGDQQKAEAEERARNEKDQESHVVKRLAFVLCGPSSVCVCP